MADLSIDRVQLEIVIKNDVSRKRLRELEEDTSKLKEQLKQLEKQGKQNTAPYKETQAAITRNRTEIDKLINSIGLTGLNMDELRKKQHELNTIMKKLDPRLPEYKELEVKLKAVNDRIAELRSGSIAAGTSMNGMASSFRKSYGTITAVTATITGFLYGIRNTINSNAALSDSMSDVAKSTGMSMAEIKELNKELGTIDTRTSRKELLDLAYVAGKLGYTSQNEVLGFVKAADQIGVALSKDLGGNVEEAVNSLGKLVDVFGIKDENGIEKALLKTGSAINSLGAASTASESYIVEFTRRLGGVAPQAGISIENIMGLAATLDQLGQSQEVAATAVTQLINKMFLDPSKFAKIAGIEVGKFARLLQTDANEALVVFLKGIQKNKGGLSELTANFAELGVDGTRSLSVIGALANNIDILTKTQQLSNIEFEKGNSLTNEFNIKNDNMASNLDKLTRGLKAAFVNSDIMDGLNSIVSKMAYWFSIPLSEKMAQESIKVNSLASEMTDYNISSEQRNKLYTELNGLAPQILEGINKEAISVDLLTQNLAKYNEQMINRILLQQKQEEIEATAQTAAKTRTERIKAESALRKGMLELQNRVTKLDASAGQQFSKIMNDQTKTFEAKVNAAMRFVNSFNNSQKYSDGKMVTIAVEPEYAKLMEIYVSLLKEETALVGETKQLTKEKSQLSKELGLDVQNLSNSVKTLNANTSIGNDATNDVDGSYQRLTETLNNLESKMKDLRAAGKEIPLDLLKQYNALYAQKQKIDKNRISDNNKEKTSYEKLGEQISKTKSKLMEYIRESKFLDAKQTGILLKGLAQQESIIKKIAENGGDVNKFLEELTDDTAALSAELDENLFKKLEEYSWYIKGTGKKQESLDRFSQARSNSAEADATLAADKNKDLFGLTGDFNTNWYLDQVQTTSGAALEIWKNAQDAKLEYELNQLERARTAELANKNLTEKQKDAINEKYRKREASIKTAAFKKQQNADVIQAIINTALSVTRALATSNYAAAVAAGIAGAAQVAVIKSQPVPQYAKGKYQVTGADDNRTYLASWIGEPKTGIIARPSLIAENGGELIIDAPTTSNMMANAPQLIEAIYRMAGKIPQRASGKYDIDVIPGVNGGKGNSELSKVISNLENKIDKFNQTILSIQTKGLKSILVYGDYQDFSGKVDNVEDETNF